MASFDFIDASAKGYEFVWQERKYIARAAIPVLFVKILCLLGVFLLGAQDMFLRQGLISMPSFAVEAVFVVGLIRYFLYREAIFVWGRAVPVPVYDTEGGYKPDISFSLKHGYLSKKQCMQGAIAAYLLLKVIAGGISALMMDHYASIKELGETQGQAEVASLHPLFDALIMMVVMLTFIWSFRLLWVYIPIAMGYRFSDYLRKMSGIKTSFYMIAVWFVCFLPLVTLLVSLIQLIYGMFPENSAAYVLVKAVLESGAEIILICVPAVAMTHGIAQVLLGKAKE